jgi:hypothetical protein
MTVRLCALVFGVALGFRGSIDIFAFAIAATVFQVDGLEVLTATGV